MIILWFVLIATCFGVEKNNLKTIIHEEKYKTIELNQNINNYKKTISSLENNNRSLNGKVKKLNKQIKKEKKTSNYYKSYSSDLEKENKNLRKKYNTYNSDLNLLSRIIFAEAGNSTDEDMLLVGTVVLNRVNHKNFPNTLRQVVYQKGQYSPTWNGAINKTPSKRAIENAKRLLNGERFAPKNVVFQAQFKQGSGVWKKVGSHYYCYE